MLATEKEGANRARILSALVTGTFITGDDFSNNGHWSAVAKSLHQNPELLKIMKNGKAFRPLEGNTDMAATEMFTAKVGNDFYLAVFNYSDKTIAFSIDLKRLGLLPEQKYTMRELLHDNKLVLGIKIDAHDAALYRF